MRTAKLAVWFLGVAWAVATTGCMSDKEKELRVQNAFQARQIGELSSELQALKLELKQKKLQLDDIGKLGGIEEQTLREDIAALEKALAEKNALIARMKDQLIGVSVLPPELSTLLEDFANKEGMVTYDASRGIVKFKSDLLFDKGKDTVAPGAVEAVKALCAILNTDQAKEFDIIIAGHTDDIPIGRPETRDKHPTNWHLSVHRAIAVQKIMKSNSIAPERTSVRGFGEYRPVAPNKPNKGGNPANRRVEIYIVPRGT